MLADSSSHVALAVCLRTFAHAAYPARNPFFHSPSSSCFIPASPFLSQEFLFPAASSSLNEDPLVLRPLGTRSLPSTPQLHSNCLFAAQFFLLGTELWEAGIGLGCHVHFWPTDSNTEPGTWEDLAECVLKEARPRNTREEQGFGATSLGAHLTLDETPSS